MSSARSQGCRTRPAVSRFSSPASVSLVSSGQLDACALLTGRAVGSTEAHHPVCSLLHHARIHTLPYRVVTKRLGGSACSNTAGD